MKKRLSCHAVVENVASTLIPWINHCLGEKGKTNRVIHGTGFYPVDSAIHLFSQQSTDSYPASRGFYLAWLLPFTKSFAWLIVNAKSHASEKPLLTG